MSKAVFQHVHRALLPQLCQGAGGSSTMNLGFTFLFYTGVRGALWFLTLSSAALPRLFHVAIGSHQWSRQYWCDKGSDAGSR